MKYLDIIILFLSCIFEIYIMTFFAPIWILSIIKR